MYQVFQASDGLKLAYYVDDFTKPWKEAPTLVLLHSAMGHSGRFFSMVPPFLDNYRVVRMDLRGHGQSEVPSESPPLSMERLIKDAVELLDHLGIMSAHFLGNSAGGYIAQRLAITAPERVCSLLLFGSAPGLKHTNALSWLSRIAIEGLRNFLADTISNRFNVENTDPSLVEWFLDEAAKNDAAYVARFISLMASLEWSDELHCIKCPTLVVIPGAEAVGGVQNYDSMRDNIADVALVTLEGMAHNICDAAPERCTDEAIKFLKRRFPSG